MLFLIFKIINPDTRIVVSYLRNEIEESTLANFVNNVKYILDHMSSNYSSILDKGERHENYVRHIYRDIFWGKNSTSNCFVESYKDDLGHRNRIRRKRPHSGCYLEVQKIGSRKRM